MKLKQEFMTHTDGDEQMMIDTSAKFSGMVRNNSTAAFIVDCMKTDTTEAEITARLLEKYDVYEDIAAQDVKRIVDTLRSIGAVDE